MVEAPVAGFWIRFVANLVDGFLLTVASTFLQGLILYPIFLGVRFWKIQQGLEGADHFFKFYDPLFLEFFNAGLYACIAFPYYVWGHHRYGATVGKKILGIEVVDRSTGKRLSIAASIRRCFGYLLSYAVVGAGFLMVAFNSQKLGLHDWIAGSMSIRRKRQ